MNRKWLEKKEYQYLSEYAAFSSESKGRVNEEKKCDLRTCFQRDRDRIIHSKSFRRLKHKTQVFIAPEGDHYRTRLTHTLEVAQISRTIARALRLNEDLTEAVALGHDLGHTPFGHAGEDALTEVMEQEFKHNQQSLRVVDHLEKLNLTAEVREGIVGHTGEKLPQTLEGQIVRISDRIAYINHDIDDALRAGIIKKDDLPQTALEVLGQGHSDRINTMICDMVETSRGQDKIKRSKKVEQATKELRNYLNNNVYVGSEAKKEENKAKNLLKQLFKYYRKNEKEIPDNFFTEDCDKEQAILDYVAGMSDVFALNKGKELFIPRSWKKN